VNRQFGFDLEARRQRGKALDEATREGAVAGENIVEAGAK
jgi:hypothetical protein